MILTMTFVNDVVLNSGVSSWSWERKATSSIGAEHPNWRLCGDGQHRGWVHILLRILRYANFKVTVKYADFGITVKVVHFRIDDKYANFQEELPVMNRAMWLGTSLRAAIWLHSTESSTRSSCGEM